MLTPAELTAMREREAGTTDEACCDFNYEVRFDFPRLLDEVERLQKENERLAGLVEKMKAICLLASSIGRR